MFKRRRATSTPAAPNPPSASASLAATKAFLQDRQSNANLSSAAAAAALRTHPQAPTAVGQTMTKRMARKSSISSQGSGSQHAPALRRHSSSGSMTERSFRVPSPNHSPVPPDDAPPVPAVPKIVPTGSMVHRRASSLEPRRGGSPSGRGGGGRGVSVDTGNRGALPPGQRVTSLPQLPEYDQDGRRSVNFSRPISPPTSPTQPQRAGHSGWFAGPVVNPEQSFRGAPQAKPKPSNSALQYEAQNTWQSVQNAADRTVSTRRGQMSQGVEGARLNTGSMRAKPSGSSVTYRQPAVPEVVDPNSPDAVYDPSTRKFVRKQDAMAIHRQLHEEEQPVVHYTSPPKQYTLPPQQEVPHSPLRYEHVPEHMPERSPSPPRPQYVEHSPVRYLSVQERSPTPPERTLASPISFHVNAQIPPSPSRQHAEPESPIPFEDARIRYTSTLAQHEEVAEPDTTHALAEKNEPRVDQIRGWHVPVATHETGAILPRRASEEFAEDDIRVSTDDRGPVFEPRKQEQDEVAVPVKQQDAHHSPSPRVGSPLHQLPDTVVVGRGRGSIRSDRGSSLSPQRNAHFAAGTLELPNGFRHQPPPRSVSPAKSALKASPSTSRRNSSPFVNNGRTLAKGSVSDNSDIAVEEGSVRKRRPNRVSFEEAPIIAGTSAYGEIEIPSSPTGLGQSRWSPTREESLEDLMKPRAALPSFGSIRRNNRRGEDDEVPEKVTETVSSSLSASVGSIRPPVEASSDHAIGSIVAHDLAHKKQVDPQDPLPPEVTSVEGSGYYSDSSSDTAQFEDAEKRSSSEAEHAAPEPKSLMTPADSMTPVETKPPPPDVPVIALQPATPNLNQNWEPKFMQPGTPVQTEVTPQEPKAKRSPIPGGWDDEESEPEEPSQPPAPSNVVLSPSVTFAEPTVPRRSTAQESESSDDDDSIYSDAYEDLTDAEDGGFASIDQIVESPIPKPGAGLMQSRFADTSSAEPVKSSLQNEYAPFRNHTDEWEAARQQWTGAAGSQKQQTQDKPGVTSTPPAPAIIVDRTPKAEKRVEEKRVEEKRTTPQTPVEPPRKAPKASSTTPTTPAQPRKSALKKTTPVVQATPPPESHMRKTMRGTQSPQPAAQRDTGMRKSMRSSSSSREPNPGMAASRFSPPPAAPTQPKGALQKRNIPPSATVPRPRSQRASEPITSKPLTKALTYDSDSDASVSSFQRERQQRRSSRGANDRISMRRSMRSEPVPTMRAAPTARPISPPTKPMTPPPSGLRKSMRAASPEPTKPKSSRFSIRSLSPAGRLGKSSKQKAPAPAPAKAAYKSRFADSSDEEDVPRPRHFQSRFADSDDEEEYQLPQGLAPVRGIPKRPGEEDGDSTDLEDEISDDERVSAAKAIEKGHTAVTNGNTGLHKSKHAPELPTFESGKKAKAKRGFFGLGKKKSPPIEPSEPATGTPSPPIPDIPLPPPHQERGVHGNRPLTPIGEDKDLETSPAQPVRPPKLQRRVTPQWGRSTSDSWPLPTPPPEEERPNTSDGMSQRGHFLRPTLGKRHSSGAQTSATAPAPTVRIAIDQKTGKEVAIGRTGKKKKFQGLRRVFGLND